MCVNGRLTYCLLVQLPKNLSLLQFDLSVYMVNKLRQPIFLTWRKDKIISRFLNSSSVRQYRNVEFARPVDEM